MAPRVKAKYMFVWLFITSVLYFSVQTLVTHSYSFMTPLDGVFLFVPEFVWVYHTLIPVIIGTTVFSMQRRDVFFTTVLALTFAALTLTIFHILLPSFYPREPIDPTLSLSVWLVQVTRAVDSACNTFPSGHVAFAWVLYFCVRGSEAVKRRKSLSVVYLLWAALISLSTLMLKQHYIFDVIAGIFLAHVAVTIAKKGVDGYLNEMSSPRGS